MTVTTYIGAGGRPASGVPDAVPPRGYAPRPRDVALDPLEDDLLDDDIVIATRRAVCRVALVAAEAASRFQREGGRHDAMAWMLAPRALFGGASPIDACLGRDACMRGVLAHRLSLALDVDPDLLDDIASDDAGDDADPGGAGGGVGCGLGSTGEDDGDGSPSFSPVDGGRLFTATVAAAEASGSVQAFHASLAAEAGEFERRLRERLGSAAVHAVIVEGFDASDPLVDVLVSPAIADILIQVAADPTSSLAAGLDLLVEQRFSG